MRRPGAKRGKRRMWKLLQTRPHLESSHGPSGRVARLRGLASVFPEILGGPHKCLFCRPEAVRCISSSDPPPRVTRMQPDRDQNQSNPLCRTHMLSCMANVRGLDDFPAHLDKSLPLHVRQQFARLGRAGAALRLYRRRGWNDSAVLLQRDREAATLTAMLDELEHLENNPPLF